MSRLTRNRNMNSLIESIETIITKSQCSLSAEDLIVLNEAIAKIQSLKSRKGLTNKHLQREVAKFVELINQFPT